VAADRAAFCAARARKLPEGAVDPPPWGELLTPVEEPPFVPRLGNWFVPCLAEDPLPRLPCGVVVWPRLSVKLQDHAKTTKTATDAGKKLALETGCDIVASTVRPRAGLDTPLVTTSLPAVECRGASDHTALLIHTQACGVGSREKSNIWANLS
jgi:hypothetical protein